AAYRLCDTAQNGDIAAPLAAVRRPESKVSGEEGADERLIAGRPDVDGTAVPLNESLREFFQRFGEFRVAHRLFEPQWRAEVHDVEHRLEAKPLEFFHALVRIAEVEHAPRVLEHMPGKGVTQMRNSKLLAGPA